MKEVLKTYKESGKQKLKLLKHILFTEESNPLLQNKQCIRTDILILGK